MKQTHFLFFNSFMMFLVLLFGLSACAAESKLSTTQPRASITTTETTQRQTQSKMPDTTESINQAQPTLEPIHIVKPELEPTPEPDRSAEWIYSANPELTPVNYESKALLPPTGDMGQDYLDRLTFICDSPTYWMWPFGLLSGGKDSKQIWTGPEGTMTLAYQSSYAILDPFDRVERPIRDVVDRHKPDILIIALGINGISFMDEAYFTREYTDLVTDIQSISPDTILILQSIYPITHRYKHWGAITNAMITEGNSWILKIAEETGCHYLDTISVLLNDEGNAKNELMRNDGLHPNADGLKVILNYIRHHGYDPQKEVPDNKRAQLK